jgi:hypothetical protein
MVSALPSVPPRKRNEHLTEAIATAFEQAQEELRRRRG